MNVDCGLFAQSNPEKLEVVMSSYKYNSHYEFNLQFSLTNLQTYTDQARIYDE